MSGPRFASFFLLVVLLSLLAIGCGGSLFSPPPPPVAQDDLNSLRTHLVYFRWQTLSLSPTETIVITSDGNAGVPYSVRLATALYDYCKAQGGKLVSGEGLESISFDDIAPGGRYDPFTARMDLFKHFGSGKNYRCEGGNDPFTVYSIIGASHYFHSTQSSTYYVIDYIKTTKPDKEINYEVGNADVFKNISTVKEFITSSFKGGTWFSGKWSKTFFAEDPTPILGGDSYPFDKIPFVWKAALFCKAHGGNLHKIINGRDMNFETWVKKFFLENRGHFYYYDPERKISVRSLDGFYYCADSDAPFMAQVKSVESTRGVYAPLISYKVIVKPGIDQKLFPTLPGSPNKINKTTGLQQQLVPTSPDHPVSSLIKKYQSALVTSGAIEDVVALNTAVQKKNVIKQIGSLIYEGIFNGNSGQCAYVSVIKKVQYSRRIEGILNYKICNNRIVQKAPTTMNDTIPSDIEPLILQAAKMAQTYGSSSIEGNGSFRVTGTALRDEHMCKVEVKVFHGMKLIKDEIVNACALH